MDHGAFETLKTVLLKEEKNEAMRKDREQ